jgi:RNA polymerase sigma-70 factor (ECF subfamily)
MDLGTTFNSQLDGHPVPNMLCFYPLPGYNEKQPAPSGETAEDMKKFPVFYEQFVAPLENRMLRSIWRVVRTEEDARDTLQEALAVIWRKQDIIKRHPNPRALILKICLDCAYDALRKNRRFQHPTETGIPTRVAYEVGFQLRAPQTPGFPYNGSADSGQEILAAVGRLTRNQALAVLMRIVQDEPYAAIAQVLGCSEVTARIHVLRARANLKRELAHLSGTAPPKGGDL